MGKNSKPVGGEKKNEKTKEVRSSNHTECSEDKQELQKLVRKNRETIHRHYVGYMEKQCDDRWLVRFARHVEGKKFKWPEREDVSIIDEGHTSTLASQESESLKYSGVRVGPFFHRPRSPAINSHQNHKSHNQNRCGGSKFQQSRLLPRFAKRRENLLKDDSGVTPCDTSVDLSSTYSNNTKDASLSLPPFVYAREKHIRHSLPSHATAVTFNPPSASIGNTIVSSCSLDIHTDDQPIASTSKSNSFDHSDQYDSSIGASGQPASSASSVRSSPGNHCKIITPTSSGKNANSNEVSDSDIEINSSDTAGSDVSKINPSGTSASDDDDVIFVGEFRKEIPPQQQTVSEKEVEALKKECSERHLLKDLYALNIKKEKLDDCIKNPHNGSQSGVSRSGQSGLPPQFAKQRGNLDKADSVNNVIPWDMSVDFTQKPSNTKDALAYPPPSVTSWEKPITHSAHLHSPVATSNTPSTSISNTILSSCSSVISTDDQVIASTSDHSDQHDSDICVSDHPASASSSERSSPSNDYKIIIPMITENSNEVSDLPLNQKKSSGSRFRQKRFPPRIAKQRENLVKAVSVNNVLPWDVSVDLISKTSNTKDYASTSLPSSAIHSSCSHSPVVTSNSPSSCIGNTIVRSCSSAIPRDDQVVATKSSSFYHSDQHDSGIGINDQPASALSSQRSSPTNDFQIISPTSWGKNANSAEIPDLLHNRKKIGRSKFTQKKFPPQIAKQRENVKAVSVNNVSPCDIDSTSKPSNIKNASPSLPSSVNVWEKPVMHSLDSHSPVVTSNAPSTSIGSTIVSSCPSVIPADEHVIASMSKSSSFDHSDQHDSGIGINDQPVSMPSSQRSSPSYCKIISPKISEKSANSSEISDLPHNRNKSDGSNFKQSRLPPRFTKQRENLLEAVSVNNVFPCNISSDLSSKTSNTKDALPYLPPSVTSWEKPFTHSVRSHSPVVTSNTPSTSIGNTIVSSCSSVIPTDVQMLASTSKSSTFHRSDQHDSAIDISDQPAFAVSFQRSPQSNDFKVISCGKNANSNEVLDLVSESHLALPNIMEHPHAVSKEVEISTSYVSFSGSSETTDSIYKNADNSSQNRREAETTEMSFRENSPLQQNNSVLSKNIGHSVTSVKSHIQMEAEYNSMSGSHCTGPLSPQLMDGFEPKTGISALTSIASSVQVEGIPSVPSPPPVLFTSSQQVSESHLALPNIMEHPHAVSKEVEISTSYVSFSGSSETTDSIYKNADNSSQNRREAETTEMSFRENSPLQQNNSVLSKNIGHSVTSVKSHIQMEAEYNSMSGSHCTGPLSPQLMDGFEPKTGISALTSIASSVQVEGIPSVPSPPPVLFTSSQQVSESHLALPNVMEHPHAVSKEVEISTSYVSFSGSSETTDSIYKNADNSSQNRREAETTEMSFRENSPLQQNNSVLSKNIGHSVTSVKSHIQMEAEYNSMSGSHCTGPLSPQLMDGFEPKTGINALTSIASSVQVEGIPSVPSPPPVLFTSSQQDEENSEMKLEFTFESCLEQLSGEKRRSSGNTGHSFNKSLARSTNLSNFSTNASVQSPISPSADNFILKIQSVKKDFESDPPLPAVMEHPHAVPEEIESSTSCVSFSGSSETTDSIYNNADNSSQSRREAETTEMSFRENSPLQQSYSVLSKNIDHSVTSVKSHIQMATEYNSMSGSHCTGEIPSVPSPPPVLFTSSQQGEENSEIKLEFTFESDLEQLSGGKRRSSGNTGHLSKKSKSISRSMDVANSSTNLSVLSPSSPSTDDLILKIQSVKKVWGNDRPLPIIMEHPHAVPEELESSTSYGSFSGSSETTASVYNNADNSSQNKKVAESTEMSFRENSLLQQSNSVLSKNIDHNVTSVKSHIEMAAQHNSMAGPYCTGPVSPPLMGGFEAMTGIYTITGFSRPVQVPGIPAVRSPPTVFLNCSQQVLECDPPFSNVVEHPQVVPSEDECSTSYGSFLGSSETTASVYNNTYNSSQAETTEMPFRENSPLQLSNSVLSKNIHHSSSSVKSHFQMAAQHNSMAGSHHTGPPTPPLMSGFEAMTGNCAISGFSSSVQVAGTSAIPCPPTVLFNCSQQPQNKSKSGRSRFGRYRLPSRFVKQRKNLVKAVSVNNVTDRDISGDQTSETSNTKDASPSPPPSVNAWELPIIHSIHPHFPVVTSNTPSTSIGNTIVSSCSSVIPTDVQMLSNTSKSSTFHRSDQHDSAIDISDQPASAVSFQRSPPSNDCQIIAPTSSGKNANSNKVPDLDVTSSSCDAFPSIGASLRNKFKDSTAETEEKAHSLTFHSKRKNSKVNRSPCKISKKKLKKSRHLETSSPSPSLCDYIFDYHKLPKDFNCTKCSFSCLSWQMFKTHSCSEKLKQMAACKIIVEKIPDNHNKHANQYICPKCCSNNPKHSCDERLRTMQNCFVKLKDIKFNIMWSIKVAQICNHLHHTLILKAKQNVLKNAKICHTVDEAMQYIVEPIRKINVTFNP